MEADFFNLLLRPVGERLGCKGDRLDHQEILNHRFMTDPLIPKRPLPKVRFKKGKEVDKMTSFTYGMPVIGIELLKDYCIVGSWIIFPNKQVLRIKTNRTIVFYNEEDTKELVESPYRSEYWS